MERHTTRGGAEANEGARRKKPKRYVYHKRRLAIFMLICMIIVSTVTYRLIIHERDKAADEVLSFESDEQFVLSARDDNTHYTFAPVENEKTAEVTDKPEVTYYPDKTQDAEFNEHEAAQTPSALPTVSALITATITPKATPVKTSSPTPALSATPEPINTDLPYYLYFEKGSFTLTIYEKDENGEYTKVYKTYRAAHGGNKTPAGKFELLSTERWHEFPDGGFVQYAVRYHARLYLHSPLYGAEDPKMLWPMYYDGDHGIGKESTGGCIRMVTEAARFIYENCPKGTVLEIVNGAPKGTASDPPPSRNGKRVDPTDVNVE